jgi:hypothetical protein
LARNGFGTLAPRIPAEQRFSRTYRGPKELIDHINVSHALVGKIAQDHVTTDAAGPAPSCDIDTIDSELRLLAAVRRVAADDCTVPSIPPLDELVDERHDLADC